MSPPHSQQAWYPQPKAYIHRHFSVDAPDAKPVKGETIPRRNARTHGELQTTPEAGVNTVWDVVVRASKKFGNAKALGYRTTVRMHEEVKKIKKVVDGKETTVDKKWNYYELSEYTYLSFIDYERFCIECGSALRKLGLEAGDRLHLFAGTSPFWLAMAHGALSQSMSIVTAYDTLGIDGLRVSLQQTKAKAMFLDAHLLPKLDKPLADAKDLAHLIYNDVGQEANQKDIDDLRAKHPHITIHSLSEFRKLGQENKLEPVAPSRDDLACIMFTSGSTGTPKGVLLKHKNVIAAIVGPFIGPGDGLLTYLPLAHILEFAFENACLFWGGTMGYGNPKTLTDASVRNCKGDIAEFKPTILVGVPQVWETVKKGIIAKVNGSGHIVKNMFWASMSAKSMLLGSGLPGSVIGAGVLDSIVFNKIKAATGGRLRIAMNGGGSVSKDTQRFISFALCPMIIGYGLTETVGMGTIMAPEAWNDHSVGEIQPCVEIKLVDYPEAGYFSANSPPQGEIYIRGDCVTEGYLDLPKENAEAFTEDHWFKTGDIGEFDSKGQLCIIDRKKNLVKMSHGEYIALEKLESVYRSATVVGNIMVHADSQRMKPIAVIVPVEAALKKLAAAHGIQGSNMEEIIQNDHIQPVVLKELQDAGKKGGLSGIEIIDGVVLADEEWTPANVSRFAAFSAHSCEANTVRA
ncbi:hypothetical protein MRB53_039730 [Persea americana]|nr:hypothetical protein MRB53_039730 [Persea americana]